MSRKIDKILRVHDSFEAAELYDLDVLNKLSGEEKIMKALELMAPYYEITTRLERVYRVVEQKELPISDNWRVGL